MTAASLPPIDAATEAALRASIEKFGVIVPVLFDQEGELLDGSNRIRLAGELGCSYPSAVVEIPAGANRAELLASLNDDRRQRMTKQERLDVVAALRSEGHSQTAIANAVGVSQQQVARDLDQLTQGCKLDQPDRVTGLDGKTRPATRTPAAGRARNRRDPRQQFTADTDRKRELANGQRKRIEQGIAEARGIARGLAELDYGMAASGATVQQWDYFITTASRIARDFNGVAQKLKEVARHAQ